MPLNVEVSIEKNKDQKQEGNHTKQGSRTSEGQWENTTVMGEGQVQDDII